MSRLQAGFVSVAVAAGLFVAPRFLTVGAFGLLGPLASAWLWVPAALWFVAMVTDSRSATAAWALRLVARLAVWMLLGVMLADPARNAPDLVGEATASALSQVSAAVRWAVGGLVVLVVAGMVIGSLVGGPSTPPSKRSVTTGSTVHPLVAMLARGAMRLAVAVAFAILNVGLWGAAWTIDGRAGIASLRGRGADPVSGVTLGLARASRASGRVRGWSGGAVGRASAGWGTGRQDHGVWIQPVAIVRDEDGVRHDEPWPLDARMTLADRELRELCLAVLAAYDVILIGAPRSKAETDQSNDPRRPGSSAPRLTPYRLAITRAWSTPEYHAAIVEATQPAGTAVARATLDVLLPALDSSSGWSAEELRSVIHLSDRRVAADPLRQGAIGLSVAMDRQVADVLEPAPAEPTRAAVERALREAGLSRRFRYESTEDGYDGIVHEWRASFRSSTDWAELETAWKGLQGAVGLYARNRDVRMEARIDPVYAFIASFPKPPAEFPSAPSTGWRSVVMRHPAPPGHPMRVVMGLDQKGDPVTLELAGESSSLLVAGSPGTGKTRCVFSVLSSILWNELNTRQSAGVELALIDSVKSEASSRFGRVARWMASATDPDAVVALMTEFVEAMDQRYAELGGRPFDPTVMPRRLLVIEELGDVQDLMDGPQRNEFTRLLTRSVNLGRACGHGLLCSTQRPSSGGVGGAVVGPRIRSSMARLSFYLNQASDYAVALDRPARRLLPRVPGRAALIDATGDLVILQALDISDADIADVVARFEERRTGGAPAAQRPEPEPRKPTPGEVERLDEDPLTALRLLYRWRDGSPEPLSVSVRGLMDRVRAEGFVAGRTERYTAALAALEDCGILEPSWPGVPTSPRRIVPNLGWEEAVERLRRAGARLEPLA